MPRFPPFPSLPSGPSGRSNVFGLWPGSDTLPAAPSLPPGPSGRSNVFGLWPEAVTMPAMPALRPGPSGRSAVFGILEQRGAALYVGGRSAGPYFEGVACGATDGTSPVIAGVGWDGTPLWGWAEDGTPDYYRSVTALAADARGCYAAIAEGIDDWKIVALDPSGGYRWEVESTTAYAYPPRRLALRGGVLGAVGTNSRDLLLIDTSDGSVLAHHTGAFAHDDVDESWVYSGSAAVAPSGTMYAGREVVYDASPAWGDFIMGSNWIELVDAGGLADDVRVSGAAYDAEFHQRLYPVSLPGTAWFGLWAEAEGLTSIVGNWSAGTTYNTGDAVRVPGQPWPDNVKVSTTDGNVGNDPTSGGPWRLPDWSDPTFDRYIFVRMDSDLVPDPGGNLVYREVTSGDSSATLPAVDEETGLIVTNIYDYAGGQPILEAFDTEGTPLWSHDDGDIVAEWAASALAAGNGRVVVASYGEDYGDLVFDILDATDGTRMLDPFVVGADSTRWWECNAIAIG